jgi:hypothetical protein
VTTEWTFFPGEGKPAHTTILPACQNGEFDRHRCNGWAKVDGEFVICVCPHHLAAEEPRNWN